MDLGFTPAVPHLTTALSGPLLHLEELLLAQQSRIEFWLRAQWRRTAAPFYASVDLRNAGFKLAPVDTNLFPAGFNNLNPAFTPLAVHALQAITERLCPEARGILIVPESHTRNIFYLESLAALTELIERAGFAVRVASLLPPDELVPRQRLPSGRELLLHPLERSGDKVKAGDFEPCVVLLNNDLSAGRPAILENLIQKIVPPLALGWTQRLKSGHFAKYREVAAEFAALLDLDPWHIDPLFRNCGEIDFMARAGEDCLADNVDALLAAIRQKYREYEIDREPFVVVKADAGTYGMGIMMVHDADEVRALNRKQRTHMAASKAGQAVRQVIMQEGVYTFETYGADQAVAEPVVYMIDHYVIGGFYRLHQERGPDENLNSPGMAFEPLAFAASCSNPDPACEADAGPNRFYAYGVIARLALLAAAREIAAQQDIPAAA